MPRHLLRLPDVDNGLVASYQVPPPKTAVNVSVGSTRWTRSPGKQHQTVNGDGGLERDGSR